MPRALIAFFIAVLLGTILWWSQDSDEPVIRPASTETVLDAFMNNFTMKAMDEVGEIALTLSARSLKHYSNTELAELEQPRITLLDEKDQHWQIESDYGQIDHNKQHVTLMNEVKIQRIGNDTNRLTISTESLDIDIARQIASTEAEIMMVSDEIELRSKGMILNNQSGKLNLLADVKGIVSAR